LTAAGLRIHIGPVFQQKASGEDTNPDCRQKQRLPALSWKDLMLQLTLKKKTMIRQKKTPRFLQNREIILHKKRPKNTEVSMDRF
jgi:hypothetical protein